MIYIVGLFFILGLMFWTPLFLAIVDMYVWYFANHNLTGMDYGSDARPMVMLLCFALGMVCMGIAANAIQDVKTK